MADGGIATQETPTVEWTEEKALNANDQQLLSVKMSSVSMADHHQRPQTRTVDELLEDRDELWREHGRSLCAFLEREQSRLLRIVHQEIDQLQRKCGDATLELANALTAVDGMKRDDFSKTETNETKPSIEQLQRELNQTRKDLAAFHLLNETKDQRISELDRRYSDHENRFRDDVDKKSKKIKEIGAELNQKAAVITQMMTQLHQLRLREAVEKQKRQLGEQQTRRRQLLLASNQNAANAWLQNEDFRSFDRDMVLDAHTHLHRPGIGLLTSPAPVRSSILPPIFASSLGHPSSFVNNIEKPERSNSSKPFRSSSFRRTYSSHGSEN